MTADSGAREAPRSPVTSFFKGLGAVVVVLGALGWITQEQLMESKDVLKIPYFGAEFSKFETEWLMAVIAAAGFVVYVVLGRGRI